MLDRYLEPPAINLDHPKHWMTPEEYEDFLDDLPVVLEDCRWNSKSSKSFGLS